MFKFWKLSAAIATLWLCLLALPYFTETRNLRLNSAQCLLLFVPAIFAWLWAQVRIAQLMRWLIALASIAASILFTWMIGSLSAITMISIALLCTAFFFEKDSVTRVRVPQA